MSEFTDGFDEVYDILADATCGQESAITCGTVTKGGILGPFIQTKAARNSGYVSDATNTAAIKRANFVALGISDRSVLKIGARVMKVIRIEDDDCDTIVLVHLNPERV